MSDNLDKDLLQLFEEKNLELPEEPFRAELRRRIEKSRTGYSRMYWTLTVLALAACAVLTTFVIDGVTLLCETLVIVLQSAGGVLANPAGWTVAAAAALLPMVFSRRVLSMLA